MAFTAPGQGTYLTIDRSINETSHVVSVGYAGGGSQITLIITVTGPDTGNATASGHYGAAPFSWSGPVNLSANPVTTMAAVGFKSSAFASELAQASYLGPACKVLAGLPSGPVVVGEPVPVSVGKPLPVIQARNESADDESWFEFLGKATVWGLAAVGAAALTAGTGGLDLLVVGGVFLTGADASMLSDDITLLSNENPDPGPDPVPVPDPDPDPDPDPGDPGGGGGDGGGGGGDDDDDGGGDDGGGDGGGGGGCFAAGTLVATERGAFRPIEEVSVDDLVASRDELTRADGNRRVLRTWIHYDKKTVDLRLETGETIRTTSVHRVFTVERGVVDVGSLRVGDHVRDALRRAPGDPGHHPRGIFADRLQPDDRWLPHLLRRPSRPMGAQRKE